MKTWLLPCDKAVLDNYELHNTDTECKEAEGGNTEEC